VSDITHQIEDLLWRRLDGELTEAEAQRLADALADSAEGARLEAEVAALYQRLASVESENPPAELATQIHALIAEQPAKQPAGRHGVVDRSGWFRRSFSSSPLLRYAAAAILVIVVVVGYQLSRGQHGQVGDNSQYTGTISSEQAAPAVQMSLGATRGEIAVSRQGENVRLSVNLTSQETVELRVRGTGAGLRTVRSEHQLQALSGFGIETDPQSTIIWSLSGPAHFVLLVQPLDWDQRLELSATVNGHIVAGKKQIELGDLPR
jgi:hypothetical protein